MDAQVTWQGRMSFTGTADSGFTIGLGTEPEFGGDADGFRPLELMLVSLAGCTAMDVVSILAKKRQELTAFEVRVSAPRAEEHPRVFTGATISYHLAGRNIDEAAVLRAIELSATRYCPAQSMLGRVFPMELRYEIREEDGGIKRGSWQPADQ